MIVNTQRRNYGVTKITLLDEAEGEKRYNANNVALFSVSGHLEVFYYYYFVP